jgi:hypothetical protein
MYTSSRLPQFLPQSTHRVATAAFWRTFHHDGKIAQAGGGVHAHAHPFHTIYHHVQSCSVRSSWEDWYILPISYLSLCTRWFLQSVAATTIRSRRWNSWTYTFLEVFGHNLESSQTWGFYLSFLLSTNCYSWTNLSVLHWLIVLYGFLKP